MKQGEEGRKKSDPSDLLLIFSVARSQTPTEPQENISQRRRETHDCLFSRYTQTQMNASHRNTRAHKSVFTLQSEGRSDGYQTI